MRFSLLSAAVCVVLAAVSGCAAPTDEAAEATSNQTSASSSSDIDATIQGYPGLRIAVAVWDVKSDAMLFERSSTEVFWSMSSIKPYIAGAVFDARARNALVLPEGWDLTTLDVRMYEMLHASANHHGPLTGVAGGAPAVGNYFRDTLGMTKTCVVGDRADRFCAAQDEKTITARDAAVGFARLRAKLTPTDFGFITGALDAPLYNYAEDSVRAANPGRRFFYAPKVGYYPNGEYAVAHETAYVRMDDRGGREFIISVMTAPRSAGSADYRIGPIKRIMRSAFAIASDAANGEAATATGGEAPAATDTRTCFSGSLQRSVPAWWCIDKGAVRYQCDPANPTDWPDHSETGKACTGTN